MNFFYSIVFYITVSGVVAGLAQNSYEKHCGKKADHMETITSSLLWVAMIPYVLIVDVEKSGCGGDE